MNAPGHFTTSLSGVVIGVIVKALRLHDPSIGGDAAAAFTSKSILECFSGKTPTEKTRTALLDAFARALLEAEVLPSSKALLGEGIADERHSPHAMYTELFTSLADRWDTLAGWLSTQSAPVRRPELAAMPYLRLVVIDLAFRFAGLLWLHGVTEAGSLPPEWAEERGGGRFLNRLREEAGMTRAAVVSAVGASGNTVDAWMDGAHPPSELYLPQLATKLAAKLATDTVAMRHRIRRTLAMAALGDELSKVVGRERVRVLALKLLRYANLALYVQGHRRASGAELRAEALASLLGGSDLPSNRRFLQFWVEEERSALWKTELRWASRGSERWLDRLQHCIRIIGGLSEETVAALEDDEGSRARQDAERIVDLAQVDHEDLPPMMKSMTEEECRIDPAFAARHWAGLGSEASTRGDLVAAVEHTRRAVALEPLEAEHHFFLGARLGQLGQVDEALSECWLATRLRPEWDRPRVEVGIILYNARRFAEAANHLEETERVLSAFPPNLGYVLGRTRLALADPAGALTAFERALELEPNHALALDAAAYCAFVLGHPTKGPKYAKEANHLGQAATYEAWKRGEFRKRK